MSFLLPFLRPVIRHLLINDKLVTQKRSIVLIKGPWMTQQGPQTVEENRTALLIGLNKYE